MAAITTTGALFAWGGSSLGQVGNTGTGNYSGPNQIGTNSWTIVSAGQFHTVAQDITGSAYGWGQGSFGNGSAVNTSSPVLVNTLTNIKNAKAPGWKGFSIASGTIYGLTLGDSLFAWGANTANKFAFNDYGSRSTPDIVNIRVSNLSISDVAIGNNTMIAVTTDNETNSYLHAWGNNAVGQYGDGTTVTRSSPVLITQLATGYTANLFSGGSGSNFRR
jgi:alpha-tubulin suppressor-like RCC1 family protein